MDEPLAIDADTKRKREVVLEFISQEVRSAPVKEPEPVVKPEAKLVAVPEMTRIATEPVVLNEKEAPQKRPVPVKTDVKLLAQPPYNGPVLCVVPRKVRIPLEDSHKTKTVPNKHSHHGHGQNPDRYSASMIKRFLRKISAWSK